MLCIPQQTVEAVHSDICGSMFEKVVDVSFYLSNFFFPQVST